ncbi:MAG: hypothetical protein V4619_12210 [Bacteroidota bacterium]
METLNHQTSQLSNAAISEWFDKFISHISVDKMMLETNTAPAQTDQFYRDIILENHTAMNSWARVNSTTYFIRKIVEDYLYELSASKALPQKLAFDFSDAKILVWAQIANSDDSTEDALILSEAKANAKYSDNGFYVSSTIVEESDNLIIPPHYHEVVIQN